MDEEGSRSKSSWLREVLGTMKSIQIIVPPGVDYSAWVGGVGTVARSPVLLRLPLPSYGFEAEGMRGRGIKSLHMLARSTRLCGRHGVP